MGKSEYTFYLLLIPSLLSFSILTLILIHVVTLSLPAFMSHGLSLLLEARWNPVLQKYGLLPALLGTLLTGLVSILIVTPISLSLTFFICDLLPGKASRIFHRLIEVMGALPTVVYGLWGGFILSQFLYSSIYIQLHDYLDYIPLFSCKPLSGQNILSAGIVLGLSMIPYASSLLIEGYKSIPSRYIEAAYSLGFYRFEVYRLITGILKPLLIAAIMLSLSRALGETTIVALTIGNAYMASACMLNPGTTMSAWIVSQFESSFLYPGVSSILYAGVLIVMMLSFVSSSIGIMLINRWRSIIHG
ncbi:PstC family ABC transporter permease [Desulfurococcus amylolyticus]|uniref:PstC family ABC transporter permease n=1 Tax=Desulfurococcus TaxID=2273 RepID=UPI0023F11F0A|nr:ABC transporter permease subunit [Desulfurococcus amylolyticus]